MREKIQVINTEKKTAAYRIGAAGIAIVALVAMTVIGIEVGKPLLQSLEDPAAFQEWIQHKGAMGRLVFVGLMALQVVIAWLPGEPLELGAGYAFGFWEGSLLCMAGILLGSVFVFLLVRAFGRRLVTLFFPAEKIDNIPLMKDTRRLTLLSFIIFMIPGTPKDILTYCAGLTTMKLPAWLLVAGVARIPPVITSTFSGSALGEQRYGLAAVIFGMTILLSLLGMLYYRHISKQAQA